MENLSNTPNFEKAAKECTPFTVKGKTYQILERNTGTFVLMMDGTKKWYGNTGDFVYEVEVFGHIEGAVCTLVPQESAEYMVQQTIDKFKAYGKTYLTPEKSFLLSEAERREAFGKAEALRLLLEDFGIDTKPLIKELRASM